MDYAKLIDHYPVYAPRRLLVGDAWVYNPAGETLIEMGYSPVILSDPPEVNEHQRLDCKWIERDGEILQLWSIRDIADGKS